VKESDGEDLCGAPGVTVLAASGVIQLGGKFAELQFMASASPVLPWRGKQISWRQRGGKKGLGFSPGWDHEGRGALVEKGIRRESSVARDEHAVLVLIRRRRRAASLLC
jgi:hypothetical protein